MLLVNDYFRDALTLNRCELHPLFNFLYFFNNTFNREKYLFCLIKGARVAIKKRRISKLGPSLFVFCSFYYDFIILTCIKGFW